MRTYTTLCVTSRNAISFGATLHKSELLDANHCAITSGLGPYPNQRILVPAPPTHVPDFPAPGLPANILLNYTAVV